MCALCLAARPSDLWSSCASAFRPGWLSGSCRPRGSATWSTRCCRWPCARRCSSASCRARVRAVAARMSLTARAFCGPIATRRRRLRRFRASSPRRRWSWALVAAGTSTRTGFCRSRSVSTGSRQLNRRLAAALGADDGVVTKPHTILRPAGSVNRKHSPPAPVRLLGVQPDHRVSAEEIDAQLPQEPAEQASTSRAGSPRASSLIASSDPLRSVPPPVYFERLTGLRVGPSGKLRCLFHDDRSPSLHVYREPGRGWYCFGCGRGGSIYDLAALLSGRETRGPDFAKLRRELEELMR